MVFLCFYKTLLEANFYPAHACPVFCGGRGLTSAMGGVENAFDFYFLKFIFDKL